MLKQDIQTAMIAAMKEKKDKDVQVLRFLISQIRYEEINAQKDLTDEQVQNVLAKEVKKRKESIEMYKKAGRQELVDDESYQVGVIERYLPELLSEDELKKIIDDTLAGQSDTSNKGKIIGLVMAKVKGKADGSIVAKLINEKLVA